MVFALAAAAALLSLFARWSKGIEHRLWIRTGSYLVARGMGEEGGDAGEGAGGVAAFRRCSPGSN